MSNDIMLILDSLLDDYYFLWECFSEYSQVKQHDGNLLQSFTTAIKNAYKLDYIFFYRGEKFDGDEILLDKFVLDDSVIAELLNWKNISEMEIRLKTSELGAEFLEQQSNHEF